MMIREPAVAGRFYPADAAGCGRSLDACFAAKVADRGIAGTIVAGLVPHAGWMCSGRVTAAVFAAIGAQRSPATFIILGAVHRVASDQSACFSAGRWEFPTGSIAIDDRLAERIMGHTNLIVDDPYPHEAEHSIEVQVPFIHRLFPKAKLLPIMVPPTLRAVEVGDAIARTVASYKADVVVLASSDLTHYGPSYGFTPKGGGEAGVDWAFNVNDARLLDLIESMNAKAVVPEAAVNRNACGAGAIAAAISYAQSIGADSATVLDHTTSREILGHASGDSAVGYAGVVMTLPKEPRR